MANKSLEAAYFLLRKTTPLQKNCGRLCAQSCCRGDENTGMRLFPFEEEQLGSVPEFTLKATDGNYGYPLLVCNGTCPRDLRPLACRLFPLFPLVTQTEAGEVRVSVIYDPRAKHACPLAREYARLRSQFVRAVRRAGKYLIKDPVHLDYLLKISRELSEWTQLEALLTNK
ncbi:MAG: hypothetical protein LBS36_10625 [Oscillospiraceae bacterium]|jgi:hypothetical protein|nr:hypothetical protein [Oscillospiraceae bacterium]